MENNEQVSIGFRESSGSLGLQRRSSMKQKPGGNRCSMKEPGTGVKFPTDKTFKRKITWTSEVDEEETKTPDKKYRDSKTFYSDKVRE